MNESYSSFLTMISNSIIILLGQENSNQEKLTNMFGNMLKDIKECMSLSASIGVGQCYQQLSEFRISMQEARQALKISKQRSQPIVYYEDMGIYAVLSDIENKSILTNIYNTRLEILHEYDSVNDANFVETLKEFLDRSKNMYATAQALFIHRD